MKVLSPFGPKIAIIKIPLNLVKKINDEVESIIKDKKKLKSNDYSKKLVGQVEQEIELKALEIFKKFKDRKNYIFNVGEGLTPDLDPEKIKIFLKTLRSLNSQ